MGRPQDWNPSTRNKAASAITYTWLFAVAMLFAAYGLWSWRTWPAAGDGPLVWLRILGIAILFGTPVFLAGALAAIADWQSCLGRDNRRPGPAWSWMVPFWNLAAPFSHLRRLHQVVGGRDRATLLQAAWIGVYVGILGLVAAFVLGQPGGLIDETGNADTPTDALIANLNTVFVAFAALAAIVFAITVTRTVSGFGIRGKEGLTYKDPQLGFIIAIISAWAMFGAAVLELLGFVVLGTAFVAPSVGMAAAAIATLIALSLVGQMAGLAFLPFVFSLEYLHGRITQNLAAIGAKNLGWASPGSRWAWIAILPFMVGLMLVSSGFAAGQAQWLAFGSGTAIALASMLFLAMVVHKGSAKTWRIATGKRAPALIGVAAYTLALGIALLFLAQIFIFSATVIGFEAQVESLHDPDAAAPAQTSEQKVLTMLGLGTMGLGASFLAVGTLTVALQLPRQQRALEGLAVRVRGPGPDSSPYPTTRVP